MTRIADLCASVSLQRQWRLNCTQLRGSHICGFAVSALVMPWLHVK